jgi:hypothetical protein
MKTPYLKFVGHLSHFILFLILLAVSALRDHHTPTVVGKHIAQGYPFVFPSIFPIPCLVERQNLDI